MKKSIIFQLLFIIFCIAFVSDADERAIKRVKDLNHKNSKVGKYTALIIGIKDYEDSRIPDLQTPLNDADAMAEILEKKYGFNVTKLLNEQASREGIYNKLRELAARTESSDSVLIYYAGHGELDKICNDGW